MVRLRCSVGEDENVMTIYEFAARLDGKGTLRYEREE